MRMRSARQCIGAKAQEKASSDTTHGSLSMPLLYFNLFIYCRARRRNEKLLLQQKQDKLHEKSFRNASTPRASRLGHRGRAWENIYSDSENFPLKIAEQYAREKQAKSTFIDFPPFIISNGSCLNGRVWLCFDREKRADAREA